MDENEEIKRMIEENNKNTIIKKEEVKEIEKTNKEKIDDWNKKIFKNFPAKVVLKKQDIFYKIMTILFFVVLVLGIILICFSIYNGNLSNLFSVNSTANINNQYDFTPEINAPIQIDNEYKNNFTFNFDISEELKGVVCNV